MTRSKVLLACALSAVVATAAASARAEEEGAIARRVLLISVDGLHAVDLARYVQAKPTSTLAELSKTGVTYSQASASRPTDSFPGLLAQVTGGSPISTGVYYDDSYDRTLSPPLTFPGGSTSCTTIGTETLYDESIDMDLTALDGGGAINPDALPRDPKRGCTPVLPHMFLRANTIFEVAKAAHLRTAWADKHRSYEIVNGPSGDGVDDLYTPEVASNAFGPGTTGGIWTDSIPNVEAYDTFKVDAIVNEVNGFDHTGQHHAPVPAIFGMNFQAVSVAQKLPGNGYADALGTPSAGLQNALDFVDASLGSMVAALTQRGLLSSTLIIVSAKHGQSPIDLKQRRIIDRNVIREAVNGVAPGLLAHASLDAIGLVYLKDASRTSEVVAALRARAREAGIQKVYAGDQLQLLLPTRDSRTPDIVIQPVLGAFYADNVEGDAAKGLLAEHGGTLDEDTHVPLIVSFPGAKGTINRAPVQVSQVAPTVLAALGLDPNALKAVQLEGTPLLPGVRVGH